MSLSRILVGIIFIALIAWGIFWLNDHGYFDRANVDNRGAQRADQLPAVPPAPATTNTPAPATTNEAIGSSSNTVDADADFQRAKKQAEDTYRRELQDEAQGKIPVGTARADYESSMRKAEADHDLGKKLQAQPMGPGEYASTTSAGRVQVANTTPAQDAATQSNMQNWPNGWPKGAVSDTNGNPCRPIQPRAAVATGTPRPRRHRMTTYAPPTTYMTSTTVRSCGYLQTTSDGMHTVQLPAGMLLNASVDRTLSTASSVNGDTFVATLVGPITYCGHVIVPAGAQLTGTVALSRRHPVFSPGNSLLELKLDSMQANGYNVAMRAGSVTEQNSSDLPLRSVTYDNGGREYNDVERTGRDVTFPANSVVSFWLQSPVSVAF